MTIDHIAVYLGGIPVIGAAYEPLRILGRISAPLFLFAVVQGLRHTRSKEKYALRLYIASFAMTGGNLILSFISKPSPPTDNIFATFFYVALYVLLGEKIISAFQKKDWSKATICIVMIAFTMCFVFVEKFVYNSQALLDMPDAARRILIAIAKGLFPSPFTVEYSLLFVMLGIVWYIFPQRNAQCVLFAALSAASFFLNYKIPVSFSFRFYDLFVGSQYCMILALPFIFMYNGERGKSMKYFFYIYYPLNIYALFLLGGLFAKNMPI
jgi:hypothetical protein